MVNDFLGVNHLSTDQYQQNNVLTTSDTAARWQGILCAMYSLVLALLSRNCPLRKQIKQLFLSFLSLFFLLCPLFCKDSVKSLKIWKLKFVFILKWVNILNRYHNQYLLKLLTVSFCCLFSYCQIYYIFYSSM